MARPVTVTIPHKLGKAEARARVESSVGDFKSKLASMGLGQMQHVWADDRLNFHARMLGQNITGRLDVREDDLRIEVDLPAFLAGLADKIAGKLKKEGRLLIEKK
jgi:hypothetical protein